MLEQKSKIFSGSQQSYDSSISLLIQNMYFLLCDDRGSNAMYDFVLLVFECIHSVIDTLDIHPVHKTCLTLPEI